MGLWTMANYWGYSLLSAGPITDGTFRHGSGAFTFYSPAHLRMTDPDGIVFQLDEQAPPGVIVSRNDSDGDGDEEEMIGLLEPKVGSYLVEVIPFADADPDAEITLELLTWGHSKVLVDAVRVADIPKDPIVVKFSESDLSRPYVTSLGTDRNQINEGQSVVLFGGFADSSPLDVHDVSVDWGDGTTERLGVEAGERGFSISHTFANEPTGRSSGDYTISMTVADPTGSDARTTVVTVCNVAPLATSETYAVVENVPWNVGVPGVLSNDIDVPADTLTAFLADKPAYGALVLNQDGSFTYTPDKNFNREDSFSYRANDGVADSQTVTVNVTVDTAFPWYNGIDPLDVSDGEGITPIDALMVINVLNSEHMTDLPTDRPRPLAAPFLDVNRDGQVNPFDALLVINYLNSGEGEGEMSADLAVPATDSVAGCRHGGPRAGRR